VGDERPPKDARQIIAAPSLVVSLATLFVCVGIGLFLTKPALFFGRWNSVPWQVANRRSAEDVGLDSARGALLPLSQSIQLANQCSRPGPAIVRRAWSPTTDQLRQLELDLAPMLRAIDSTLIGAPEWNPGPLGSFYRQYGGLELVTGEKIIYVNAFHATEVEAATGKGRDTSWWRREPVSVCDGWRGFWGVEYDPGGRRFRGFSFNDKV
jgi:hypothetical protein